MKLRALVVVLCASLLVVPAAFAEVSATMGIAGDVETNTDFTAADDGTDSTLTWSNNGRTHIKFDGRIEGDNGWFAYGKGDAMIDVGASVGVDDAYVEFGTEAFSFLIGRYEAPGLFGKGQDTFIVGAPNAPGRYQADYTRGRNTFNNIALKLGSIEIGAVVTTEDDMNLYGARPVYTLSSDAMTLKVGGEFATYMPTNSDASDAKMTKVGGGANIEVSVGGTLGASVAYGMITGDDADGNALADESTLSSFVYYTMPVGDNSLGLAGGLTMYTMEDVTDNTMFEGFVSFNQQLPVEGLWIKYAASFAGASFDADSGADPDDTSAFGARVRFNYAF